MLIPVWIQDNYQTGRRFSLIERVMYLPSESRFTKSIPEKQKIKLKGGAAVDPDSGLDDVAHVYQVG